MNDYTYQLAMDKIEDYLVDRGDHILDENSVEYSVNLLIALNTQSITGF